MSHKHCGHHGHDHDWDRILRRLFAALLAVTALVLFIVLVVWLVLRPTKPRFYLQDTTISYLSLAESSGLLSVNLQVTLSSRNPNDRVGIYYDKLDVYAEYKDQQITVATALPPSYQGHNDVTVWSPFLDGPDVPLAPYLAAALAQDQSAGYLLVDIKIDGRLRWKVGTWISGHYHINVNCPAFLSTTDGHGSSASGAGSYAYHFQQISSCSVDV